MMIRLMKKILLGTVAISLLTGCGGRNQAVQTEMQAGEETNAASENVIEETAAMHTIFLKGDGSTWLFADAATGAVFTATIPENLTDAAGNLLTANELVPGNQVDIYGDGIMLQSYPGQYPGVTGMVVTATGSPEDAAFYQEEIDMFFVEPDLSQLPQLSVSYTASYGQISAAISGPGSFTWDDPDDESGAVTACGPHVLQWENLCDINLEEPTELQIESDPLPAAVSAYRWPLSEYMTEGEYSEGEAVTVTKGVDGSLFIMEAEAGYVYRVIAEWEMGEAEYAFITPEAAE